MDELKEVESEKVGEWMNTELVDICGTYIWNIHLWYIQMEYFKYLNFNHHIYVVNMLAFGYVVSILNCICVGIFMLNLSSDLWLIMWLCSPSIPFVIRLCVECLCCICCDACIINIIKYATY
jgi:hypothetical protein